MKISKTSRKVAKAAFGLAAALHLAVVPLGYASMAHAASTITLPAPYISRALDAVLIPIDDTVRTAFGLGAKETGVLVLAVEPKGVAASYGIEAGDVISQIKGHKIASPIDVDTVVYYWINLGAFDFLLDYYRGGTVYNATSYISLESYNTVIDVTTVSSWESTTVESFSYSEYASEYSEEITTSYESSETTIEETATSEDFSSEVTSETTDASADLNGDGTANADDTDDTDDDNDGIADEADGDDDGDGIVDTAKSADTDGDGTADAFDTDDDNDGIADSEDADDNGDGADDPADESADSDGDGIDNADDADDNNDGADDSE